jgi:hypothetical protein
MHDSRGASTLTGIKRGGSAGRLERCRCRSSCCN